MEQTLARAHSWALLVDPAAAQSVIERMSKLDLPRRICRPLDGKCELSGNTERAQFDAAIEAAVELEAACDPELAGIEPARSGT